jgi:hypothetical protein
MNVNLLQGLPSVAAGTGDAAPGDANAALRRHRAWQSAMEQAQLANWFKLGAGSNGDPAETPQARTFAPALLTRPIAEAGAPAPAAPAGGAAVQAAGAAGDSAVHLQQHEATKPDGARPQKAQAQANPSQALAPKAAPALDVEQQTLPPARAVAPISLPAQTGAATPMPLAPSASDAASPARLALSAPLARVATAGVEPVTASTPAALRADAVPLRLIANQVGQWLAAPEVEATESTAGPGAPAPRVPEQESADGATRLHVEWTREGARLWLGVDQDQLQRVPTLIGQLQQWLASSGVKLLALVCNGRTVYQARRAFVPGFPPQGDFA